MSDNRTVSKSRVWLVAGCWLLAAVLGGCESLERKFSRKAKTPQLPPNPIISFQDYTRTMTPLDRYRKHYLMFDYWNSELIDSLQDHSPNPKRFKQASSEALTEFQALQALVVDEVAIRFVPFIEERMKIHQQLHNPLFNTSQASLIGRQLEAQTRQIHRDLSWRNIQDQLKPFETIIAAPAKQREGNAPGH